MTGADALERHGHMLVSRDTATDCLSFVVPVGLHQHQHHIVLPAPSPTSLIFCVSLASSLSLSYSLTISLFLIFLFTTSASLSHAGSTSLWAQTSFQALDRSLHLGQVTALPEPDFLIFQVERT